MNNKIYLAGISFILVILLINNNPTVSALRPDYVEKETLSQNIQKVTYCEDTEWQEEEPIQGLCPEQRSIRVCDDESNTSCHQEDIEVEVLCVQDWNIIQKTKRDCVTKGYKIYGTEIDTEQYECLPKENNDKVTLICDSRFDGNGDGICTSGESCMKFVIRENTIEKFEKNSQDNFIEEDESFFLERAEEEDIE